MPIYQPINIKKSIAAKLLATVFVFYVIVTLTVTSIHMISVYYNQKKQIAIELQIYQKTFEKALATALWELDKAELESILTGIIELSDVIGIIIKDHKGNEIFGAKGVIINQKGQYVSVNKQGKQIPGEKSFSQMFSHKFSIEYSHEAGKSKVGEATIYSNANVIFYRVKLRRSCTGSGES